MSFLLAKGPGDFSIYILFIQKLNNFDIFFIYIYYLNKQINMYSMYASLEVYKESLSINAFINISV